MEEFINDSGLIFTDISTEICREYLVFSESTPLKIVGKPIALNVSNSGNHRLYTNAGWSYYINPKERWAIRWKTEKGKANFVK